MILLSAALPGAGAAGDFSGLSLLPAASGVLPSNNGADAVFGWLEATLPPVQAMASSSMHKAPGRMRWLRRTTVDVADMSGPYVVNYECYLKAGGKGSRGAGLVGLLFATNGPRAAPPAIAARSSNVLNAAAAASP